MKTDFALLVSPDGIALAHRQDAGHWALVSEARLDDGDLDAAMAGIKREAAARGGAEAPVVIVLPDDQVLYTSFTAPADDLDLVTQRITDGLDGLTPYAVADLAYDWHAVDQDRVKVAVVARETLTEAAAFAATHGFESAGFAAMPPAERFPGMPLFTTRDTGDAAAGADRAGLRDLTEALGLDRGGMVFGADTYVPPPPAPPAPPAEADKTDAADEAHQPDAQTDGGAKRKANGKSKGKATRAASPAATAEVAGGSPAEPVAAEAASANGIATGPASDSVADSTAAGAVDSSADDATPKRAAATGDTPGLPADAPPEPVSALAPATQDATTAPAAQRDKAAESEGALQRALFDDAEETPRARAGTAPPTTEDRREAPLSEATNGTTGSETGSTPIVDLFLDQTIAPLAAEDPQAGPEGDASAEPLPPSFATASRGKVAGAGAGARPLTAERPAEAARLPDAAPRLSGASPTAPAGGAPEDAAGEPPEDATTASTIAFAPRRGKVARPDGDTAAPIAGRKPRFGLANPAGNDAAAVLHPDADAAVTGNAMPGATKPGSRLAAHLARVRDASRKSDMPPPDRVGRDGERGQSVFGVALPGSAPATAEAATASPDPAAGAPVPRAPATAIDTAAAPPPADAAASAERDVFDAAPGAAAAPGPARPGADSGLFRRYLGRGAQRQATGASGTARGGENAFSRGLLARKSADPASPSLRTGLLLTLVLLVLLALIAIWSALFLPDSPMAQLLWRGSDKESAAVTEQAPVGGGPPVAFSAPPAMGARDAGTGGAAPDARVVTTPAGPVEVTAETTPSQVQAAPEAAPTPAPVAVANPETELAEAVAPVVALPDIDADFELPPLPPSAEALLPSVEETALIYAEDGIWPRTPDRPSLAPLGLATDVYVASLDPEVLAIDAIALALPAIDTGETLRRVPPPPAFGEMPVRDARGLIAATPEGVLTPEGAFVVLGRPPVLSVPRPREVAPTLDSATPATLGDAGFDMTAPTPRPGNLGETRERQVLGGFSERELAGLRPEQRPVSVQETARAEAVEIRAGGQASLFPQPRAEGPPATAEATPEIAGTELAVAASRMPRARPDNIAVLVAAAVQTPGPVAASPSTAAAVAAAATTSRDVEDADSIDATEALARGPSIPSSADVARAATERNAIRLRSVNLIGVTGSASDRRALVRLPSGRFVRVGVGDQLDGGRVAAIGQGSLQYVRNGRNMTLEIPG